MAFKQVQESAVKSLNRNFGTFSFTCISSHNVDTQDGDNEAAEKSYSEAICASVNTEWCARSYDLRGKLSSLLIIHETPYITISTNKVSQ